MQKEFSLTFEYKSQDEKKPTPGQDSKKAANAAAKGSKEAAAAAKGSNTLIDVQEADSMIARYGSEDGQELLSGSQRDDSLEQILYSTARDYVPDDIEPENGHRRALLQASTKDSFSVTYKKEQSNSTTTTNTFESSFTQTSTYSTNCQCPSWVPNNTYCSFTSTYDMTSSWSSLAWTGNTFFINCSRPEGLRVSAGPVQPLALTNLTTIHFRAGCTSQERGLYGL